MPSTSKKTGAGTQGLLGSNRRAHHTAPLEVEQAFAQLELAKANYENFRKKNATIIEQVDLLRAKITEATEEVKARYLANKDILGPHYHSFTLKRTRKIDAALLVELMPEAKQLVHYTMPVKDFEAYVENGTISEDIAELVVDYTDTVTSPR